MLSPASSCKAVIFKLFTHTLLFQQPFMEVKISEGPRRARRDSGLDCDENSPESRCCRYPLTVDFEDFGWDWIIAPKRYKANYCSGECEYMHLQKYPHTHLVNKANPRGTAGPCCTPTKMSPINMLYFNRKEQIIYGKIPSMVVDRCGCSWVGMERERGWGRRGRGAIQHPTLRLFHTTNPPVPVLSCRTRCNRIRVEATNSPTFLQGNAFIVLTFLSSSEILAIEAWSQVDARIQTHTHTHTDTYNTCWTLKWM